jgi:VPS62-like protein
MIMHLNAFCDDNEMIEVLIIYIYQKQIKLLLLNLLFITNNQTELCLLHYSNAQTHDLYKGNGFGSGSIDFGGLHIAEVTTFNKVWATYNGGPDGEGATFFEPVGLPEGYFLLGYYAQRNNRPLFGRVLVAKDTNDRANPALKWPIDYALVWSSHGLSVKADSPGYIWAPIPSDGYQAVGLVVTTTPEKPPLDKVRCVRNDFTTFCEPDEWIWGREGDVDSDEFNIFESRPVKKGKQVLTSLYTQNTCINILLNCYYILLYSKK